MNTKDLLEIAIVKRKKLQNTLEKQITTVAGNRRKLLIVKADYFLGRSKKLCILSRILITLTKFPTCLLEYDFLFTSVDSN